MIDILFIGAHPDDCELFTGGTIAKLCRQGYKVGILDLTAGELSSRGTLEERLKEAKQAAKVLGVTARETLNLGDTSLRDKEENIQQIVEVIRKLKPGLVFLGYPTDRHPDHNKATNLAQQALFYARLKNYLCKGQPHKISAYCYYLGNSPSPPAPTFIVDISDTYKIKIKALRAYKSQFFNPKFKDAPTYISSKEFFEFIEIRARYYGGLIGVTYGEPFLMDRPLKVTDVVSLLEQQIFR